MSKTRKPRPPIVSKGNLKEHSDAIGDPELWQLANRLEELERLRKAGDLNTPFIALEALGALSGGLVSGRPEDQLLSVWPEEWGRETMTAPLALILALRNAWSDYKTAPSGRTLGEAFQIEGGAQGKKPMKSRLAIIDRDRRLSREVEDVYLGAGLAEKPIRLSDAVQQVADANELGFETVKDAHDRHRKRLRNKLSELELLEGVKSSRS